MHSPQPSLFTRDDTLLGVCQGLGEDLGFNPLWLRVAFAGSLDWKPAAVVGAYLALGVVVLLSRLISPNPRLAAAPDEPAEATAPLAAQPARSEPEPLPIAA